jgi:hypothetical protein
MLLLLHAACHVSISILIGIWQLLHLKYRLPQQRPLLLPLRRQGWRRHLLRGPLARPPLGLLLARAGSSRRRTSSRRTTSSSSGCASCSPLVRLCLALSSRPSLPRWHSCVSVSSRRGSSHCSLLLRSCCRDAAASSGGLLLLLRLRLLLLLWWRRRLRRLLRRLLLRLASSRFPALPAPQGR